MRRSEAGSPSQRPQGSRGHWATSRGQARGETPNTVQWTVRPKSRAALRSTSSDVPMGD